MPEKPIVYDVDAQEYLTAALITLLDQYSALAGAEQIPFSELGDVDGIAFFPTSGPAVYQERESVTGHVRQVCQYPFAVVHRGAPSSERQRVSWKEQLDTLGKWLECQPVIINGAEQKLQQYPALTGGRIITVISRRTPAYMASTTEGGVQDWQINMMLQYIYEFDR